MGAVQDRAHAGNGLTGYPRRGACYGAEAPAQAPCSAGPDGELQGRILDLDEARTTIATEGVKA